MAQREKRDTRVTQEEILFLLSGLNTYPEEDDAWSTSEHHLTGAEVVDEFFKTHCQTQDSPGN